MQNGNILLTIIQGEEQALLTVSGQPVLLDVLRSHDIAQTAPCGGDGRCGRCKVLVCGEVSPPDEAELAFPGIGSQQDGFTVRLACRVRLLGDCRVRVNSDLATHKLSDVAARESFSDAPFGVAVDLGTTTIGVRAVELGTGRILAQMCELNDQRVCGADVMTRIAWCRDSDGLDTLHRLVCAQLTRMITRMTGGRDPQIIVVAGNTVMLHLLAGMDPSYLGVAPYRTREHFGRMFTSSQLGLPADAWLMPCMGGYTGGDLTAALLALTAPEGVGAQEREGLALCDLGTNGEMALRCGKRWLVTSAAAGPALEGGGISCGSGAVKGAVTALSRTGGESPYVLHCRTDEQTIPVELQVLGGGQPTSLTGSAIVSLTALLLREGKIQPCGLMDAESWQLNEHVTYTRGDVRQLQLAKGAVAAAFARLCEEYKNESNSNSCADCLRTELYITGGLGCQLKPEDAVDIGLVSNPGEREWSICFVPNLALEGAALCLSEEGRRRAVDIASGAQVLELTGDDRFDRLFVSCMRLGEPDEDY